MTDLPDANAVAEFLAAYPDFFEHNPDLIAGLKLTTTLGGRTVSLQERQVEVLRDKMRQLELKLATLSRHAVSNDVILSNFHQWVLRLMSYDGDDAAAALLDAMRESFQVPAASLRLWGVKPGYDGAWFAVDTQDAQAFADGQPVPVCGAASGRPGVPWLDDASSMQSAALLPLREPGAERSFGLLVLGSPDKQRFSSELATDILVRIGETASARLRHLIA
ncbi:MAG: DUF484 family protein [Burkholderiaceae bacterium]|nr:DUF484 family protein [Burkholderiaceae bacterium]